MNEYGFRACDTCADGIRMCTAVLPEKMHTYSGDERHIEKKRGGKRWKFPCTIRGTHNHQFIGVYDAALLFIAFHILCRLHRYTHHDHIERDIAHNVLLYTISVRRTEYLVVNVHSSSSTCYLFAWNDGGGETGAAAGNF